MINETQAAEMTRQMAKADARFDALLTERLAKHQAGEPERCRPI